MTTKAEETSSVHSSPSMNSDNTSSFIGISTGCGKLDMRSKHGRGLHFLQMVVLPLIPIIGLIVQNCISMETVVRYQSDISLISDGVESTVTLGGLVAAIQMERLSVAYYVFTNGSTLRSNLSRVYLNTNKVITELVFWPEIDKEESDLFESPQHFQIRLNDFRSQVDAADIYIRDKMEFYSQITSPLIRQLIIYTSITSSPGLWQLVEAYKSIIQAIENMGRTVIYGLNYYGRGHIDQRGLYQYVKLWAIANSGIQTTMEFSKKSATTLREIQKKEYLDQIRMWDREVRQNEYTNGSSEVAHLYITFMARFLQDLRTTQRDLRRRSGVPGVGQRWWRWFVCVRTTVQEQLTIADTEEAVSIAVLVLVLSISPIIILLVRKATHMVQIFSDTLAVKMAQLKTEKRRSDRLLYQMLPMVVAKQLRQKKQVPAESFESATVYFSDIVGFEELCTESSPLQIVTLLNSQYKVFDSRLERYDVYKVETIGDAYMVVSGLPKRNGHKHATEIGCVALDLRHAVQSIPIPHRPGCFLQIRAGVNTGPVVAGVVGTKMPRYCLFGDTVNTASRMETTCEPMRIQISLSTRMALMSAGGFIMDYRGYINVKGKGEMATYWLEGRDGLQLHDTEMDMLIDGDGGGTSNPAFLQMVDELEDSPEVKKKNQGFTKSSSR
ncbi:uncharacterized protein [Panulirus ornatus]|uniref:uncharacterized protein n=1 Tax=Panulirus ornatus TaxID=150431 RepID=UPI003A8C184A